jgi:hypothetical protein
VFRLRQALQSHRRLVALLLAATLTLRVLVPAGFMPVAANGGVALALCPGTATAASAAAMPGMAHHDDGGGEAAPSPCAYADLALPVLGAADPVLAGAALAFAFVLGLLRIVPLPARAPARLRPPLRGPPPAV